ncbi:MAG: hypothetical protein R3F60_32820 [bacterium]
MKSLSLFALLLLAAPVTAQATGCGKTATVAADIWVALQPACDALVAAAAGQAGVCKGVTLAVATWNDLANNNWATIGPRVLTTAWQSGTIFGTTSRLFITDGTGTGTPAKVKIKKTSGKGKAGFAVCRSPQNAPTEKLADLEFAEGDANIGEVQTVEVKAAKQHVISIFIDGKSAVKNFGYEVQIEY